MLQSNIVLVKFWATWCNPCKVMSPILDSVLKKFDTVQLKSINTDTDPGEAAQMNVRSIPTLILLKDGVPIDRLVGVHSKEEIETFLSNNIQ